MIPNLKMPIKTWNIPAITTAKKNASIAGSFNTPAATIAVNPAAGPLTLSWLPLINPTIIPPTTPAIIPLISFTPLATAMPKQSGMAIKKTTIEAERSAPIF